MTKRKYLIVLIPTFIIASVVGNFTEKSVRIWIEKVYAVVLGKPMVYDITQTDERGVPFIIESTIGKQRNPVTVCNRALGYYNKFRQGDSSQLILFLNCSDWLIENLTRKNNYAMLPYNYNWPNYHMTAPWRSGLANGVSLQVFVKAHEATGDQKYVVAAKQILNSFFVDVKDGGVTYLSNDRGWWFEELSDNNGYVSRVLNGHMFALLGIHDYFIYTHDSAANYLFKQGLLGLKNNLPKYDIGDGHSFYDLVGTPANVKYHLIHIDLLDRIFKITGDPVYRFYSDKWSKYKFPSLTTRLVTDPKRIDFAIWLVNFVVVLVIVGMSVFWYTRKARARQANR